ncbi:MAG: hypothetical protein PHI97_24820 [Desulfobulbus sp.]|nr:hypothetical protein [Desulfobulbus sp.]
MPQIPIIPDHLQGRMRQYRRLLLSYGDFKHAKLVAEYILSNHLHDQYPGAAHIILPALNCSMVIAYSRPFSGNSGHGPLAAPDLPGRYVRLLSPEERLIHHIVINDRNKYLAHTDAVAAALEPVRLQVSNEIESIVPLVADRMAPLDEEPTKLLLSAASKLLDATIRDSFEMEPFLKPYFRIATTETLYDDQNHQLTSQ